MLLQYFTYQRVMQIRSDDQEFQDLQDPINPGREIMESVIRGGQATEAKERQRKLFRVQIRQSANQNEKNIIQNQYYSVCVFKDQKQIKKDIKRRFSDFDMLFQILFRQYKGYILPAFPQNGIMSYVKSKVSLAKDDKYLKQRISMVERFLTLLLNQPTFDEQSCAQMRAFLSQKQFDLFKKKEKEKSQGIITSSWNKILNYMKFNQQSKYKVLLEQLVDEKKSFEKLFDKIKTIVFLLEEQKEEYKNLEQKNLEIPNITDYFARAKIVCQEQQTNLLKMKKLEFNVYCQNEDYQMVMKMVKNIENLKNDEQNYSQLEKAEKVFSSSHHSFKNKKKESIKKYSNIFTQILKQISKTDAKF